MRCNRAAGVPLTALCIFVVLTATPRSARGEQRTIEQLYEHLKRASIEVLVDDRQVGSGAIVDAEGLVLTAAHMVPDWSRRVEVISPTLGRMDATPLAVDRGHDALLLQLAERPEPYPALELAKQTPAAGGELLLFGAPMFRHGVLLSGTVARNEPTFEYLPKEQWYVEIIHVAAQVQMGTSGGPWVDRQGRLVGLQSATMVSHAVPAGIAYMAPVEPLARLIAARRSVATPTIGVAVEETWQQQSDTLKRYPQGAEGLVVRKLDAAATAAVAGVKQWDVITAVDGRTVRFPDQFLRAVRGKAVGQSVRLSLLRPDDAGRRDVDVPLAELE